MLWLLLGAAILTASILILRAFERASVATIYTLVKWIAAFGGIAVAVLLLLSGRGFQALAGLALAGPMLWRRWGSGFGGSGFTGAPRTPPPRQGAAMTRDEAYQILGLKPGADADAIHAAHRRLMRAAHPDTGGSDWLASRINQARDVLLG
jgi:hypothetical protein